MERIGYRTRLATPHTLVFPSTRLLRLRTSGLHPGRLGVLLAVLLVVSLTASQAVSAAADTERQAYVISLQHRNAESLLGLVSPLLGPGDGLSGWGQEIIVTTTPQRIDAIREVLSRADFPLHNLMISVRQENSSSITRQQDGFSGGIRRGRFRIDTGEPVSNSEGLNVRYDGLAYTTSEIRTTTSGQGEQQLRAVEGRPAYLFSGQSRFFTAHDAYGNTVVLPVDALQGFSITVQLLGDQAELTLTIKDDRFSNSDPDSNGLGIVNGLQLSTTITGPVGEWIELGGTELEDHSADDSRVKKTTIRSVSLGQMAVRITPLD